jgi:DNA-binding MarR family transcriptional regulator
MDTPTGAESSAVSLQAQMVALVRAFGLHQPEQTPCGQPLPVAEAHALHELASSAPMAQRDLARWLRLEKSTVSRLVAILEQKGWVTRKKSTIDGRVLMLELTAAGQAIASQLAEARQARFARLTAAIPGDQREAVLQALHILVEAIDASK